MKTPTLRHLATSLTDVRRYHLSRALLERDHARQASERERAGRIETVLAAVRSELATRDTHVHRSMDARTRANRDLQQLLADILGIGDADEALRLADPVIGPVSLPRPLRSTTMDQPDSMRGGAAMPAARDGSGSLENGTE